MSTSAALVPLDGITAIEASAGTGKTHTITQLHLRLVLEHELDVASILVVTYTKAATAELRARIGSRLVEAAGVFRKGPAAVRPGSSDEAFYAGLLRRVPDHAGAVRAIERALQAFDEAAIFTIHGFCQRVLTDRAFESGVAFDAELVPDQDDLVLEVVDDFWRLHVQGATPELVRYLTKAKWSPEWLRAQVRAHLGRRYARVLVPDDPPDLAALDARVAAAVAGVRRDWPGVRDRIAGALKAMPLKPASYRDAHLAADVAKIGRLLEGDPTPADLLDALGRCTTAKLIESRTDVRWIPDHPFVRRCDELAAALASRTPAYKAREAVLFATLLGYTQQELTVRKAAAGVQFYDDLLAALSRALRDSVRGPALADAIRRRYPAALIDEFQDTDPVQYDVVRRIYGDGSCPVVLVGDPKQAIYSFRGADVFSYIRARDDARACYPLDVNWRADAPLVRAVNAIFTARDHPFVFDGIPFVPSEPAEGREAPALRIDGDDGAALRIWWLAGDSDKVVDKGVAGDRVIRATAAEIARLLVLGATGTAWLGEQPLVGGHIAVLVRTNEEGRRIRQALLELGVPSVQQAVDSVFASREAAELERVLVAVAEPGQAALVRAALATEMLGQTADDLERLAADDVAWDERIEAFHEYHHRWQAHGFISMLRDLLVREGVASRLLAFPDGERRMTNLSHVAELLQAAAMRRRGGIDALIEWLADARSAVRPAEMSNDEHLLRLESDAGLVQIVTVHKAKGLQYPIVFCPSLWDGHLFAEKGERVVFHEPGLDGATLDPGASADAASRRQACEEELAERLRLLYVALTRAKHRCYLVWGKLKDGGTSPLAWLLHAGAPPGAIKAIAARYETLTPAALRAEVDRLVTRSAGTISVETLPAGPPLRFGGARIVPEELKPRALTRAVPRGFTIASFTALAAGDAELERPDFDQTDETPREDGELRRDAHGFPRGARAGRCLHAILEAIDFVAPDRAIVAAKLRAFGIDETWTPVVGDWLDRILATPLDDGGFRLGTVPRAQRADELEFYYPVGTLDLARIARELSDAGFAGGAFGDAAARLPTRTAEGFLKGAIDCVLEHDGRYFVLDYKSNRLGDSLDAYATPALVPAMARGQYWLQYLIYVVAVHRWLGRRLVGYDYDRHFGGVRYLFLRGMDPARGLRSGVYVDRPSRAVIERLDRALAGGGR